MDETKKWQIFNQPLIFFIICVCVCVCVCVRVCVCEGDGLMLGRLSTVEVRKQSTNIAFPWKLLHLPLFNQWGKGFEL